MTDIQIKTDQGKNILQLGQSYSDEGLAIWEYVVNSLQYRESDINCLIEVFIEDKEKRITISDNSSGMNQEDLEHFFTTAAENRSRAGKQDTLFDRGKYGTGKYACFGIANSIMVDSVKNGIRNIYQLTREGLKSSSNEDREPKAQCLTQNEVTQKKNGTNIIIDGLLTKISQKKIINKIERELPQFRGIDHKISVNDHLCETKELSIQETIIFQSEGPAKIRYGDFDLEIQISKSPLDELDRGIRFISGEHNYVGKDDYGISKKEYGNLITGKVQIEGLDKEINNISPNDQTRSGKLNYKHQGIIELRSFISPKLEKVRKQIADKKSEERNSSQSKKLKLITDELSEKFSKQWKELKKLLNDVRSGTGSANSLFYVPGDDENIESLIEGDGVSVGVDLEHREGEQKENPIEVQADAQKVFAPGEEEQSADKTAGKKSKRRTAGGFNVDCQNLGREEPRSTYVPDRAEIIINKEHPNVEACLRLCDGDVENIVFKRLLFEIAFREFEHAIGEEYLSDTETYPAKDLLFEMRKEYDKITRAIGTELYK